MNEGSDSPPTLAPGDAVQGRSHLWGRGDYRHCRTSGLGTWGLSPPAPPRATLLPHFGVPRDAWGWLSRQGAPAAGHGRARAPLPAGPASVMNGMSFLPAH